ncbi:acetyl-CoA C-acetyltransferase [Thalassovita taeanensis]|uniref:Acetyl-CoA C-acetyltransferase n=1 Tax=Thalassovita taeanensis TaxID=657014 RepID=A0A1H9IFX5_9RHOB|nr:acetyl-CoA C-acetyltransferase [Thalassovita taeanensis]SEQ73469.1 acetyl-CoA C-acetyltransferase [Thalassovita taeanensis]
MRDVVICEPVRTPVGRYGGQFKSLSAHELGAAILRGLVERSGLDPASVDDVIFAQCYPSMDAPALGRVAALDAGFPVEVGGLQLDRRCGSGLQAIINATMQVATGASDVVIAGGAESMSNAPFYSTAARWGVTGAGLMLNDSLARGRVTAGGTNFPVPGGMLETAENLRRDYAIPREEQDAFAATSQARAVAAQEAGRFDDEIVPVTITSRKEGTKVIDRDEHPRAGTTAESLGKLRPILSGSDSEATVTAGNASGQNDGASACIVTTSALAAQNGLRPFGRLVSWAVAGVPPKLMGIGPVPATAKALARADMRLSQIDLIELNEAFAAQVLACTRDWNFAKSDFERMNVNGSGISLGHPVGATGGRILATLLHEMARRDARYGIETMCIGGGQGLSAVFERVAA